MNPWPICFLIKNILEAAHEFRKTMDYQKYLSYLTVEPQLVSLLE